MERCADVYSYTLAAGTRPSAPTLKAPTADYADDMAAALKIVRVNCHIVGGERSDNRLLAEAIATALQVPPDLVVSSESSVLKRAGVSSHAPWILNTSTIDAAVADFINLALTRTIIRSHPACAI